MDNVVYTDGARESRDLSEVKPSFDWRALFAWFFTVVLSFAPIIILALAKFSKEGTLGEKFYIELFTQQDTLWIFATLLIVTCVNLFVMGHGRKVGYAQTGLLLASIFLAFLVEGYWLICRLGYASPIPTVANIGIALCLLSLLCCIPLQVNYLKKQKG